MNQTALLAPPFRSIAEAWRRWRHRLRGRMELAALGAEAGTVARDLNLGGAELGRLAGQPSNSAALLGERMTVLGLDARHQQAAVMQDLQRVCSSCALKSRCKNDLVREPNAVAAYCPNEHTLKALRPA